MKQVKVKIEEKLYPVIELKFHESTGVLTRISFFKDELYTHIFQGTALLDKNLEIITIDQVTEGSFGDYYAPDLGELLIFEEDNHG